MHGPGPHICHSRNNLNKVTVKHVSDKKDTKLWYCVRPGGQLKPDCGYSTLQGTFTEFWISSKTGFSAHFPSKQCTFLCLANGEMLRDVMQEIKEDPFMGNSVDSHYRRYTNKDSKAMEKVSAPAGCWWHPSRAVQLVHPADDC